MSSGIIQIWDAVGPIGAAWYPDFYAILDAEEKRRAERFRADEHRIRFVTCRGWLRLLLSAYTGLHPAAIEIVPGDHGKPGLAEKPPDQGLVFNVSHSADRMVFAFSLDCMLGVDVEGCRNLTRLEGMVDQICSEREKALWRNMPLERQTECFYSFWVRKEAIIKAQGQGISLGMQRCELSDDLKRPINLPDSCGKLEEWTLVGLEYPDSFQGALAVCGRFDSVLRRELPEKKLLDLYLNRKLV
ncbi:MAG: 4'-phosphopantetheinyl transferase family protein [Gammaproteobacteria bacterium]